MIDKWRVYKIKSDCEFWLFLEGWEKDIIEIIEFEKKEEVFCYYVMMIYEFY